MSLSFLRATPRPLTLALALFGTAASVAIGPAFAADDGASYPNRVIRFVVPNAPGGLPDRGGGGNSDSPISGELWA